ncbi:MAG: LPXTG cell wall anchor domain-containing protein [Prolixibacteraceae bacterium]
MKKLMMILAMLGFLAFGNVDPVVAQEEDVLEMEKDTLSIDDMDPVFYEGEQESASDNSTLVIIVIVVVVVGGGAYYYTRRKKK